MRLVTPPWGRFWLLIAVISGVVLIPCFWHSHVESLDLPSHVYNAWLAVQTQAGKVPSLYVAPQVTNVLVDLLLERSLVWWGPEWAEHLVVALLVLTFFWGAFVFIQAIVGSRPWQVTPLLAMVAYGTVFRWGFLNFYLSLGLSLWAAYFVLSRLPLRWLWAAIFFCLAVAAHPLSAVWIVSVTVYLSWFPNLRIAQRWWIIGAAAGGIVAGCFLLNRVYRCEWPRMDVHQFARAATLGLSQIAVYGNSYRILTGCLWLVCLPWAWRAARRESSGSIPGDVVLQLLLLHVVVMIACPVLIYFPRYSAPFSVISVRVSLWTALILCVLISLVKPRAYQIAGLALIALVFFSLSYRDETKIGHLEDQLRAVVNSLPRGQHVILALRDEPSHQGVPTTIHLLDRSCVGRCWDVGNYEAASGQFRLRARPFNPDFLSTKEIERLDVGEYVAPDKAIPLDRIHVCDSGGKRLCADPVNKGERITLDRITVLPETTLGGTDARKNGATVN